MLLVMSAPAIVLLIPQFSSTTIAAGW